MIIDINVVKQLLTVALFASDFNTVALKTVVKDTRGYMKRGLTLRDIDQEALAFEVSDWYHVIVEIKRSKGNCNVQYNQ